MADGALLRLCCLSSTNVKGCVPADVAIDKRRHLNHEHCLEEQVMLLDDCWYGVTEAMEWVSVSSVDLNDLFPLDIGA